MHWQPKQEATRLFLRQPCQQSVRLAGSGGFLSLPGTKPSWWHWYPALSLSSSAFKIWVLVQVPKQAWRTLKHRTCALAGQSHGVPEKLTWSSMGQTSHYHVDDIQNLLVTCPED